ncbi:MAG: DUF86 domain-containing protein [Bacillota bacterium]|nr:DUF86 domain-containing protein [Bacillota bacterium]
MTVDREKIRQKLHYIREKVNLLEQFKGMDKSRFTSEPFYEDAAIHMLQVAIESMLDICAHIIAREGWGLAKTYVEIVELAAKNGLISDDMAEVYKNMARFRNRVIHLYNRVDTEEILNIINNRLDDFQPFISAVIHKYLP